MTDAMFELPSNKDIRHFRSDQRLCYGKAGQSEATDAAEGNLREGTLRLYDFTIVT